MCLKLCYQSEGGLTKLALPLVALLSVGRELLGTPACEYRVAGSTQQRVGVGRVTIARIEAGTQTPSVEIALAIARVLGRSVAARP